MSFVRLFKKLKSLTAYAVCVFFFLELTRKLNVTVSGKIS